VGEQSCQKKNKDRLGWKHTRNPDNSQGAEEAAQTHEKTPEHAAQEVPQSTRRRVGFLSTLYTYNGLVNRGTALLHAALAG
jgi:hypothetical protein